MANKNVKNESAVKKDSKDVLYTMEQKRAKYALDKIMECTSYNSNVQVEIRRFINSFPAMIRMNGLGQTIAFYKMKQSSATKQTTKQGNEDAYEILVRIVETWLIDEQKGEVFKDNIEKISESKLLNAITQSDMRTYMVAQNEALAILEWLKKFALAFLDKEVKVK